MAGVAESDDPVEAVARLGARLIMQPALEDEVTEFRGRARYERADADGGAAIYRNGYEPRTVKTTSGSMALERLRIRHAAELGFENRVLEIVVAGRPSRA
jgi:putative transposase